MDAISYKEDDVMIAAFALLTAVVLFFLMFFAKKMDMPRWLFVVGCLFFLALAFYKSIVVVHSGEIGVQIFMENVIEKPLTTGYNIIYPTAKVAVYPLAIRDKQFNATTSPLQVKTSDNVSLSVNLRIRWKINPDKVLTVHSLAKSMDELEGRFITPTLTAAITDYFARNELQTLFGIERPSPQMIGAELQIAMQRQLIKHGIIIDEVLLESVVTPQNIQDELDKQAVIQQELKTAEMRKKLAQENADIQNIINTTYTQGYLQNEAIKMMRELATNKNNTFVVLPTTTNGFGMPLILPEKKTGE